MTDHQAQVNAALETLCGIAERARDEALNDLIGFAGTVDDGIDGASRREVADLALAYADYTHQLDTYRALLRRPGSAVVRMKR
jgi:hypothetical protein